MLTGKRVALTSERRAGIPPLVSSDRCNTSIWRDNENWRSRGEFQSIDTAKLKEHPYARRARAVLLGTIVMMAVFFALLVVLGLVIDNIV